MADLIVLGFSSKAIAEEVWELGVKMEEEGLVDLEDSALVWREDDGKVRIQQALPIVKASAVAGAATGAFWGTLLGLVFVNPLVGLVVGTAAGAAGGAAQGSLIDIGIEDDFIRQIGEQIQPGTAAVFALVRRSTPDRVVDELKRYHPAVLHTSLTRDREEDLVEALQRP